VQLLTRLPVFYPVRRIVIAGPALKMEKPAIRRHERAGLSPRAPVGSGPGEWVPGYDRTVPPGLEGKPLRGNK
jgi:hypothetical protein